MKALSTLLSIISLYLFYWIGRSIYISFLDGTATIGGIIQAEYIIACLVCALICFVNCMIFDSSAEFTLAILLGAGFLAYYVPYSIGFVVLFNLILIGCILITIWKR